MTGMRKLPDGKDKGWRWFSCMEARLVFSARQRQAWLAYQRWEVWGPLSTVRSFLTIGVDSGHRSFLDERRLRFPGGAGGISELLVRTMGI